MYTNKCIKCGKEFETKNPKRVICPDCLYPEKTEAVAPTDENGVVQDYSRGYSAGSGNPEGYARRYNNRPQNNQGGYNKPRNNFQRRDNQNGGYNNRRPQRPQGGRGGFNNRRPQRPAKQKTLLINKEQLAIIEEMYKKMLPLPNPDAHEVIATAIELEPKKVFFGINLVRQKMMLPKIQFPKRKLAITPDQMMAIKNLYEPLLPLPPIGCHKILAAQLKMDEWRVHVGIGLVRKQMGLDRWNPDREDCPEKHKNQN
ncbi:MAG: hypothetical protein IJ003_04370 [Candidatus Gastranaerophilales bacterium]|nr:hypothetical protein [Candidatus Gastranaerophilales bacterium]